MGFCSRCGCQFSNGDRFCAQCGAAAPESSQNSDTRKKDIHIPVMEEQIQLQPPTQVSLAGKAAFLEGLAYLNGEGKPRNSAMALQLFQKAFGLGIKCASLWMGIAQLYHSGAVLRQYAESDAVYQNLLQEVKSDDETGGEIIQKTSRVSEDLPDDMLPLIPT